MDTAATAGSASFLLFGVQFALPLAIFVVAKAYSNPYRASRFAVPAFWLLLLITSYVSRVEAVDPIFAINVVLSGVIIGRALVVRRRFAKRAAAAHEVGEGAESGSDTGSTGEGTREAKEIGTEMKDEAGCALVFDSQPSWRDSKKGTVNTGILSFIFLASIEGFYTLQIGYGVVSVGPTESKVGVWAEVTGEFWNGWFVDYSVRLRKGTEHAKVYCDDKCEPVGVGDEVNDVHPESGATILAKCEPLAKQGNRLPVKMTMIAALPGDIGGDVQISKVTYTSPQTPVGQLGADFQIVGRISDKLDRVITPNFRCVSSAGTTSTQM